MTRMGGNHGKVHMLHGSGARRWGATVTVVAVAVVLASCSSTPAATAPVAVPSATSAAPTTAPPTPSPTTEAPTVANLEIDASLFSKPEVLAKTFYGDRITAWYNAGGTLENAKAGIAQNTMSMPDYATQVAAKYDKTFIDALLVPDWESNPTLVNYVKKVSADHNDTVLKNLVTSSPDISPLDHAPYMRGAEFIKLVSSVKNQDGSISLTVTERDFDNADQNRVGDDSGAGRAILGDTGTAVLSFEVVDGKLKLSNMVLDER